MTGAGGFRGLVLAGDRGGDDPLLRSAAVPGKALLPVGGRPMLARVLAALQGARLAAPELLVGPTDHVLDDQALSALNGGQSLRRIPPAGRPSQSVLAGLTAMGFASAPPTDRRPVLITTADHALLTAGLVDEFCALAQAAGKDLVVGLASHAQVVAAYPGARRTRLRFADGAYCGCNLFAAFTPRAVEVVRFWQRVEQQRKRPWHMMRTLGWGMVAGYLLGRLSLPAALARLSRLTGADVGMVLLSQPEAAIDVDTRQDWQLVERIIAARGRSDRPGG